MARKTKAEQQAEREAAEAARLLTLAEAYPARLMAMLERAVKENFELTVKEGMFRVENRDDRRADAYMLSYSFTKHADSTLDSLEWDVREKEEARREAERRAMLRTTALNKLSAEEREVLGV